MLSKASLTLAVVFSFLLSSMAAATTFVEDLNDNTGYTVSNTDLLQTNFGSVDVTGNFNKENVGGMGESKLRNGSFENLGGQQGATAGSGDVLVYHLNTSVAPQGYDITGVSSYAGWSYGRYGQGYNLSFHAVGDPANVFSAPINVFYGPNGSSGATGPFPGDPEGNYSTSVAITDPSGFLALGVDQVKFEFTSSPNYVGEYNGYRELDVFGAVVPEPASLVLFALGAVGLFAVARRRQA